MAVNFPFRHRQSSGTLTHVALSERQRRRPALVKIIQIVENRTRMQGQIGAMKTFFHAFCT